MDPKAWAGVESLLESYIDVRPDDCAVVLYTSDSCESAAWVSAALELRGIECRRVWMAPLQDDGFRDRLSKSLPAPPLRARLVVLSFEKDTMSHTAALADALSVYDKDRYVVFRAISSCESLFSTTLHRSPATLSARNTAVLERFMQAKRLRILTRSGSDLEVAIDSTRHRWISNRGMARPGGVVVLPAGEVATFPAAIDGTFVADFAFNVNAITDQDARLQKHPVRVAVSGGRATSYECDDGVVSRFLDECFETQCAVNVGELGFGTNDSVREPIAMNSHINERRPGIHLGFGQHNQAPGVVGYQCAIHLDLIARGGLVWVDDDEMPLDLENISPSGASHPVITRDEDVFSPSELEVDDCCGIMTSDGLRSFRPPTCGDAP
ncbi:M29 family metallopeptidase [Streptomyces erythrochromogenes]|uniref:hypothetical protein n=1 Tax=Streptomyces erythrochromogenes TaxID=285574 RepID=UPI0036989B8A